MSRLHHAFSPSSLKHFALCAHYTKEDKEEEDNELANEGTLLHSAIEQGVYNYLNDTRGIVIHISHAITSQRFDLDEQQQHIVDSCLRYVTDLFDMIRYPMVSIEPKLEIKNRNGELLCFGHADLHIVDNDAKKFYIIDYKFGRYFKIDDIRDNWQGQAYALGGWQAQFQNPYPTEVIFLVPRQNETITGIIQPDEYETILDNIEALVNTDTTNIEPEYHKDNCRFCALSANCQTYNNAIWANIQQYMNTIFHTPTSMAEMLSVAKEAENWAKGVKRTALEFIDAGNEIPGYKIIEKEGKSSIDGIDMGKALQAIIEKVQTVSGQSPDPDLILDAIVDGCNSTPNKIAKEVSNVLGDKSWHGHIIAALEAAGCVKSNPSSHYVGEDRKARRTE